MNKVTLGEVAEYINGRAFKPTEWEESGAPIIRIQNLNNPRTSYNYTTQSFEEKYLVKDGDLLFAWSASLGAYIWHGKSGWLNQHIFKVIPNSNINKMYLYYYLLHIIDELYRKTHGSGMVHITLKPFKETPIYLPPLAEQHCIVDCIESLFQKLDRAKELAQNALDTFETRKAVILHKAFTGELTAKWREQHGVWMDSWEKCCLSDVANTVKDKFDPALGTSDLPYIGLEHIAKGNGIMSTGKAEDVKSLKTVFKSGDILYGKLRPYLNKHDIANFDGICSTDILAYRTTNEETAKYLNYHLDTTQFISYSISNSKGINLPRVSEKEIGKYIISIPSIPEQQEIVWILDSLFEKEEKAKGLCDILDKIDLLKKAILARAFRGELGTNDSSGESAIELLKECLK